MSERAESKRLAGGARAAMLAGVICLGGIVRWWVIVHSQVISLDGTVYIRMAQQLSGGASQIAGVARQYDYHLGYPLLAAAVHSVAERFGLSAGVDGWDRSGEAVSLIASLAGVAALWVFAERTFDWQTALITTLLLAVSRKWAVLGEDVLSDSAAVALQLWGIVFALWTLESLGRGSWRTILLAVGTGLCAGIGYLVRPEAMLTAGLAGALWIAWPIWEKGRWKWKWGSVLAMSVATVACALPYMLMIGRFTKKKRWGLIVGKFAGHGLPVALVGAVSVRPIISAAGILAWRMGEAMGFVLWGSVILWVLVWAVRRAAGWVVLPVRQAAGPGAFLMIGACVVLSPILIGLQLHVHYLDYRHATFLAMLISPLGGAAAVGLLGVIDSVGRALPAMGRVWIKIGVVGAAAGVGICLSLQPIHADKVYERAAARRLIPLLNADDFVLTDSPRLLHYAAARGEEIPSDGTAVLDRVRNGSPVVTWVAVHDEVGDELREPMFSEVIRETDVSGSMPHVLRVFRVERGAVSQ